MSTISCAYELCALDHREGTAGPVQHHRVTSEEGDPYRVVASWTDEDPTTGRVEMTYDGATVTLTLRDAAFWARALVAGAAFGRQAAMAIDLGAAAEVLFYLDPDGEEPQFGTGHLDMSIRRAVSRFFDDEDDDDEELYVMARAGTGHRSDR